MIYGQNFKLLWLHRVIEQLRLRRNASFHNVLTSDIILKPYCCKSTAESIWPISLV